MSALLSPTQGLLARRFGQVCAVSLAMLICSAFGLLMYVGVSDEPKWLWIVVIGSGSLALLSFLAWLLLSFTALLRGNPHPH